MKRLPFTKIKLIGAFTSLSLVLAGCNGVTVPRPEGTPSVAATAIENPATDIRHFNAMMDTVNLKANATHSSYDLDGEGQGMAIWYDSVRNENGSYTHRGSGEYQDNKWTQGTYRLDDISTAAVASMRHWQIYQDDDSRNRATQLLKTAMFMQNTTGSHAGLAVRWLEQDGTLNDENNEKATGLLTSGTVNPSDSAISDWFGDYVWALGEGYAVFKDKDPEFAKYLQSRIALSEKAINAALTAEETKDEQSINGKKVTQELITDNVEVNTNIVLGLSAYLQAEGSDSTTEKILKTLTDGIATVAGGDSNTWPFGAIMSSPHSPSYWSAQNSGADSALAAAAPALKRSDVMNPALLDASLWSVQLLTNEGVSNTISPLLADDTQTATGVDLRLRSLIDVGNQSEADGLLGMAAMVGGWYYGANKASKPMYDSATGAFYTELKPDKTINMNSSAEATIHGVLSMLALDKNPDIKKAAQSFTEAPSVEGSRFFDASSLQLSGTATLETPTAWTGDSNIYGGQVAQMQDGSTLSVNIGNNVLPRSIYPVIQATKVSEGNTSWSANETSLGKTDNTAGSGGKASPWSTGSVVPLTLSTIAPAGAVNLSAKVDGNVRINGIIVQPQVTKADFGDGKDRRLLYFNSGKDVTKYPVQFPEAGKWVNKIYDSKGRYVSQEVIDADKKSEVTIAPAGFSLVQPATTEDIVQPSS
ncbi:MAG: hypothetical protein QM632_00750 [Micrococcaceae bacterium]